MSLEAQNGLTARKTRGDAVAPRVFDKPILLLFLTGVAVMLAWRSLDLASPAQLLASVLKDRSGIGAGEILVMFALFWLAQGAKREEQLSSGDLAALALASLAFAFPFRLAVIAPIVIVGLKLAFRATPRLRAMGQLLLALAIYEWIGPMLFHLSSPVLLKAEAIGVQGLLSPLGGFSRDQLLISGPNGHAIYIEEGCSAFHNLSFAGLIWISLLKLESFVTTRKDWLVLAAMAVATVVLNSARIALMAQSYAMFDFWHNGMGATLASMIMLASVVVVFFYGREMASAP